MTQLTQGVNEWIEAKFNLPRKVEKRNSLCPGFWTKELVVGTVKHEEELDLLRQAGITIHRLKDVLSEMTEKHTIVKAAAGADLFDLIGSQSVSIGACPAQRGARRTIHPWLIRR